MSSPYQTIPNYFLLGKTLKSHGTRGHLRLMIDDHLKTYIKEGSYLFFDVDGSKVPYLITDVDDGVHFVVSLEDVIDKKESDLLSGLNLWVPLQEVRSRHQRSPRNLMDKWNEYTIEDVMSHNAFEIIRVEEFPQQLMAVINFENKEVLIPLSDQLITEIDKPNKIIRMEIPDGLLEL